MLTNPPLRNKVLVTKQQGTGDKTSVVIEKVDA